MMSSHPDEGSTTTPNVVALLRVVEHHGLAQRFGPCTHPVHRNSQPAEDDADGVGGAVAVRCRDRRSAVCRSCSALYRLDARPRLCHPRHGCAAWHLPGDPAIGTALDVEQYDYVGQVLFNAHAGALWASFTTQARRTLAADTGLSRAEAGRQVRVVFAKVAEFQTRGVVHLHAVIRLDPADPPDLPTWASVAVLRRLHGPRQPELSGLLPSAPAR